MLRKCQKHIPVIGKLLKIICLPFYSDIDVLFYVPIYFCLFVCLFMFVLEIEDGGLHIRSTVKKCFNFFC